MPKKKKNEANDEELCPSDFEIIEDELDSGGEMVFGRCVKNEKGNVDYIQIASIDSNDNYGKGEDEPEEFLVDLTEFDTEMLKPDLEESQKFLEESGIPMEDYVGMDLSVRASELKEQGEGTEIEIGEKMPRPTPRGQSFYLAKKFNSKDEAVDYVEKKLPKRHNFPEFPE